MIFKEEIKNCIGSLNTFNMIVTSKGGYVEGVKTMLDFSNTKISLLTSQGKIEIVGDNLTIEKYSEKDVSIKGVIKNINFCDNSRGQLK